MHRYFNPYPSPYEAFINYMNILSDFLIRVDEKSDGVDFDTIRQKTKETGMKAKDLAKETGSKLKEQAKEAGSKLKDQARKTTTKAKAKAKAEDKLILISVGYSACHWCHVMQAETLADPEVRAQLAQHFVSIRVDHDANPLLANRFRDWGWPALIFLAAILTIGVSWSHFWRRITGQVNVEHVDD